MFNSWWLYLFHKIDIKKHNYIKPEFYVLFKESLALSCHIIVADWSPEINKALYTNTHSYKYMSSWLALFSQWAESRYLSNGPSSITIYKITTVRILFTLFTKTKRRVYNNWYISQELLKPLVQWSNFRTILTEANRGFGWGKNNDHF